MRWGIKFVLLAVILGLVFPGSVLAFGQVSSFGEFGSGAGQMRSPAQLAVAANGDLYVADSGNNRISVFAGDGAFLGSFGQGIVQEPGDVALDDDGRVFVADTGNDRIDVFTAEGEFVFFIGSGELTEPAGVDVDASIFGSTVFVADTGANRVAAFTKTGTPVDLIEPIPSVRDVIVGGGGNLFVANFGDERVDVFNKEGEGPIRSIGEGGQGQLSGPVSLAADGTGGIYVADQVAQRVMHFNDDGGFLGSFSAAPNVAGVGVACQGNVFAVERSTLLARVVRFGEPGTPPPPCVSPQPEPIVDPVAKFPSSKFRFAGLVKNRGNGSAVLYVRVPGSGRVNLKGRGFRRLARTAPRAKRVRLPIKPKIPLKRFLKRHGKGRIRVEVTFTPTGGEAQSLEKVIVLKRRR